MNFKKLIGKRIELEFLDHSAGQKNHSLCLCNVVGVLNGDYEDHVEIVSWDVQDDDGSNAEAFNVLKAVIKKVIVYRVDKEIEI
jgi:dUTPase